MTIDVTGNINLIHFMTVPVNEGKHAIETILGAVYQTYLFIYESAHDKKKKKKQKKKNNGMCAQRRLRSSWASTKSDQSLLCSQWVSKDPSFLHANSEDSNQTGRMPRLI